MCEKEITEKSMENFPGREYEFVYKLYEKPVSFMIIQKFNGCSNTGNLCLSCLTSAVIGALEQEMSSE
jgi:hypothetical protein